MISKYFVLAVIVAGCGSTSKPTASSAQPGEAPTITNRWKLSDEPARMYVGQSDVYSNVRAEVVSVISTADVPKPEVSMSRWSLVRLSGVEQELNNTVFLVRWDEFYAGVSLTANIHGQPRSLLFRGKKWTEWHHRPSTAIDWDKGWAMSPVKGEEPDAEELLRSYQAQVRSGAMEALAPVERKNREKAQDLKLESMRAKLLDSCGVGNLLVDWESVDGQMFDDISVSNSCSHELSSLGDFCKRYPNVVSKLQDIRDISCDFEFYDSRSPPAPLSIRENEIVVHINRGRKDTYEKSIAIFRKAWGENYQVLSAKGQQLILHYADDRGVEVYSRGHDNLHFLVGSSSLGGGIVSLAQGIKTAVLTLHNSEWRLSCGQEELPLKRMTGPARDTVLAAAKYEKELKWKREPYFLARDTRGTYYYVDRVRREFGGRHYRVFVGRRGALKLTKLTGLVEDSEGTVFATDKGELRLVVNTNSNSKPLWISNKKQNELTAVELHKNAKLIYDELGVYFGEDLGHVCD